MSVFGERNNGELGEKGLYELLFSLSEWQGTSIVENKLSDAGDLFDVPRGELIKLILRNKADTKGSIVENTTLLKNLDDLVNAKIIADQAIAELQQEEAERDVVWREEYGNLQERCKNLEIALDEKNEIVTDLMRSVETRDFHIKKMEERMREERVVMAKIGVLLNTFSPQQRRDKVFRTIRDIIDTFKYFREGVEEGTKKK
jgi:hypothetical protein